MAEVNREIYPINESESTEYFQFTNTLNNYELNKDLEPTVCYATSTHKSYGGLDHYLMRSWLTYKPNQSSGSPTPLGNFTDWYSLSARSVIMAKNSLNQSVAPNSQVAVYEKRFGYDAEDYGVYPNITPVTGFKYYSVVGCIVVRHRSKSSQTLSDNALDTFLARTDLDDRVIVGAYLRLHCGTDKTRYTNNIQFAQYQPQPVATGVSGNPRQFEQNDQGTWVPIADMDTINRNVQTESEGVINYCPGWSTTTASGLNGFPLFGIGAQSFNALGTYETNTDLKFHASGSLGWVWTAPEYADWNVYLHRGGTTSANFYPDVNITAEDIRHMAATLGVAFTGSYDKARTLDLSKPENITDPDLYFPIMSNDGYWNGDYVHGEDNLLAPQVRDDWNSDINAPFVHGSKLPSTDPEEEGNDLNGEVAMPVAGFTHMYSMKPSQLSTMSTWLNNKDPGLLAAIKQQLSMNGASPIDSIVSIMYMPFKPPFDLAASQPVIVGAAMIPEAVTQEGTAIPLTATVCPQTNFKLELGSAYVGRKHKNFLDEPPYTSYVCYVPFCGFTDLDAGVISGKQVTFTMFGDLISGTCDVQIRVGDVAGSGFVYKTVSGVFGSNCAVTATDNASYTNGLISAASKMVGGVGAMIGTTAMAVAAPEVTAAMGIGTAIGIMGGMGSAVAGAYEFQCTPKEFVSQGKSTGNIAQMQPWSVCIYRITVEDKKDEHYGSVVGYACERYMNLGSLSGWTVCSNAEITFDGPTDQERAVLKNALETGVFC